MVQEKEHGFGGFLMTDYFKNKRILFVFLIFVVILTVFFYLGLNDYVISFTGNSVKQVKSLKLDVLNLPSMFNLKVNNVYTSSAAVNVSTNPLLFVVNLIPNQTPDAYFFGDFIDVYPNQSTNRTIISNVTG